MIAVYIDEFGPSGKLSVRDVPQPPAPASGELLVRVRAAGVNRADLVQLRGGYPPPAGYSPNIPGLEFAGEVAGIGDKVYGFALGDRVFGITAGEAQADFLRIDQRLAVPIPNDLSFTDAAAVPEAFITAHDAVFTLGELQAGQTLLVHAVGSGVGLAALQLAHAAGARVIGTSRTAEKLDRCRELGLDVAIETPAPEFSRQVLEATDGRGADVILDLVGAAYFAENVAAVSSKGRLILVGLTSGSKAEFDLGTALRKRLRIIGTMLRGRSVEEKADAVGSFRSDVLPLLDSGTVKPIVDRVFPAQQAADAYAYVASNKSFGKVILEF